jgi:hypothetical protein
MGRCWKEAVMLAIIVLSSTDANQLQLKLGRSEIQIRITGVLDGDLSGRPPIRICYDFR